MGARLINRGFRELDDPGGAHKKPDSPFFGLIPVLGLERHNDPPRVRRARLRVFVSREID